MILAHASAPKIGSLSHEETHRPMLLPFSLNPPPHPSERESEPPSAPRAGDPLLTSTRDDGEAPAFDGDALRRAALESSPLPIVALDATGRVALWSRSAEATFGWTRAEAIGTRPTPELAALFARALTGERLVSIATSLTHRDGAPLALRVSLAPLRSEAGAAQGVMAIFAPA